MGLEQGLGLGLGLALALGRALQLQDNRRAYRIKCRGKSNWYKLSLDMKDCRGIDADVGNGRKARGREHGSRAISQAAPEGVFFPFLIFP